MAKILIVDDLATEMVVMKSAVSNLGHSSVTANDGEMAVQMAESEKPDLILLDIVLPKMDGFQACRKIKKNPATAHIPVILVSTKDGDSDKFWGIKQGASDYITKPIDTEALQAAIKKNLN